MLFSRTPHFFLNFKILICHFNSLFRNFEFLISDSSFFLGQFGPMCQIAAIRGNVHFLLTLYIVMSRDEYIIDDDQIEYDVILKLDQKEFIFSSYPDESPISGRLLIIHPPPRLILKLSRTADGGLGERNKEFLLIEIESLKYFVMKENSAQVQ